MPAQSAESQRFAQSLTTYYISKSYRIDVTQSLIDYTKVFPMLESQNIYATLQDHFNNKEDLSAYERTTSLYKLGISYPAHIRGIYAPLSIETFSVVAKLLPEGVSVQLVDPLSYITEAGKIIEDVKREQNKHVQTAGTHNHSSPFNNSALQSLLFPTTSISQPYISPSLLGLTGSTVGTQPTLASALSTLLSSLAPSSSPDAESPSIITLQIHQPEESQSSLPPTDDYIPTEDDIAFMFGEDSADTQ